MTKSKILRWLAKHFDPESCFVLRDNWYGILRQSNDTYAVKKVSIKNFEGVPDEGVWLTWPEKRFESVGGACYAILLNEQNEGIKK